MPTATRRRRPGESTSADEVSPAFEPTPPPAGPAETAIEFREEGRGDGVREGRGGLLGGGGRGEEEEEQRMEEVEVEVAGIVRRAAVVGADDRIVALPTLVPSLAVRGRRGARAPRKCPNCGKEHKE